jgi:hypothetical protein
MGTIEALQGLYVMLGGDIADVENITLIPDMISAVAGIAKSAALAPYIVTITMQVSPGATSGTGTTDKTLAEIETAYNAGRKIVLRQDNGQYGFWDAEISFVQNNGTSTSFAAYLPIKNPGGIRVITISSDNALTWEILPFDAVE